MAHKVRILHDPDQRTIRMHYASTYQMAAALLPQNCDRHAE